MGCASFCVCSNDEPKEQSNAENDVGETKKRRTTDILFLLLHATVIIFLIPFLAYCMYHGDIYRIINGYDSCLNICGKNNSEQDKKEAACRFQNMQKKPYILVFMPGGNNSYTPANATNESKKGKVFPVLKNNVQRTCLQNCSVYPHYRTLLNRCVPEKSKTVSNTFFAKSGIKNFFEEVSEDLELCWPEIVYLCIIALVLSFAIMVLFRFLVGIIVWVVLIGVAVACSVGTIYLWVLWKKSKNEIQEPDYFAGEVESRQNSSYLAFAIVATIVTFCVILIILVLRKRVQLVIQLFKEAGKAVSDMPCLLFQPIVTFVSIAVAIAFWLFFCLWIESSGRDTRMRQDFYVFEKDTWMLVTRWYNLFVLLWMIQFIIGCQHMVIAGAVSIWYFTRNKSQLGSPVFYGLYNLLRYHLGSVSLGSLIIAIVQVIRILFTMLQKYLKNRTGKCVDCCLKCCQCCLYCLENTLKHLTRNAYIQIAIHGYSFCRAGKQAFKVLSSNVLRVAAINSVGDFVLLLGKVLVIVATVLIGVAVLRKKEGILHSWVPLTLIGLFAYFISHCFLSVYEMSIDTIFICFCEDCEENDGVTKPFYMSRGLMDFVQSSKKVIENTEAKRIRKAQPPTVSSQVEQ